MLPRYLSSLYFRGKLAYALRFGQASGTIHAAQVITPDRGLVPVDARIGLRDLRGFAAVPIDLAEPRYVEPLVKSATALQQEYRGKCEVILLGSIATAKYVDCLLPIFGDKLMFPADFVGRGDA